MIPVRVREMAVSTQLNFAWLYDPLIERRWMQLNAVKTLQRRVRGSMARKQVAELIQAANTITVTEIIQILNDNKDAMKDIQKIWSKKHYSDKEHQQYVILELEKILKKPTILIDNTDKKSKFNSIFSQLATKEVLGKWEYGCFNPYCKKNITIKKRGSNEKHKSTHWVYNNTPYNNKFYPLYCSLVGDNNQETKGFNLDIESNIIDTYILVKQILTLKTDKRYNEAYGSGEGKEFNEVKQIIKWIEMMLIVLYEKKKK